MNGFQKALVSAFGFLVCAVSLCGCAALVAPAEKPQALREGGPAARHGPGAAAKASPQVDSASEAAPKVTPETLAAIQEFLERTSHLNSRSSEIAQGAEPENQRNESARNAGAPELDTPRVSSRGMADSVQEQSPEEAVPRLEPDVGAASANALVELRDAPNRQKAPAPPRILSVTIRGASETSARPVQESIIAESAAANAPATTEGATPGATVEALLEAMRRRAAETSGTDWGWKIAVIERLVGSGGVIADPPGLDAFSIELIEGLSELVRASGEMIERRNRTSAETLSGLDHVSRLISGQAEPEIPTVALCRKVVTYGVYEEMPAEELVAGRAIQTIVYSEIRRFQSRKTEDGRFETRIGTRLELFTPDGKSVWMKEEPEVVDVCRTVRTDFFIAQRVVWPATLASGDYVLKVFIEDRIGGRATERTHGVRVLSPASLVRG